MLAEFATWLIDPTGLTPHGFCLLWEPGLIYLHIVSDIAIGLSYFTIPAALAIFARRRRDLVFRPIFVLFAVFILLCGTTHWMSILTLFVPAYGLEGIIKALTAVASVATAAALWPLLPKALALPSPAQLQAANAALQASEARHRATFERSPVPMQALDADYRLMAVSDTWLQLLGYERSEVIGRSVQDFQLDPADVPIGASGDGVLLKFERQFVRKDGSVVETEISSRLQGETDHAWAVCAVVDITARRRAEAALRASEERLHQAQKMEAVGQLTGGIAHDFNNMLQGMNGSLELIERRLRQGQTERLVDYIGTIRGSLDRAAGLTQRMLAFARRQTLQPRPTDVDHLVASLEELIRRTIGANIALQMKLDDGGWRAQCDPNQLESALLNLAINARDAMPDGGVLRIGTASRQVTKAELSADDDAAPGDYVEIVVEDDGVGMTPEVKARAFEPFFTTKPVGQGTGLGLSQLYGFVHQSGGLLRLESAPGHGTRLRMLLPRGADTAASVAAPPDRVAKRPAPVAATRKTVMIVDDEPAVRMLVCEVLGELGFALLEAADGDAALELLQRSEPIDLLITDIGLPGLNGRKVAELARERRPTLPVVLITGYAGAALDERALPEGMEILLKPFSLESLTNTVFNALGVAQVC